MKKTEDEKAPPIIIKRIKKGGGGHHGGAWKVAYADFVTAMMAFFLLLWLLNVTTDEQKFAISNYFDPTFPKVSETMSGAGGVMGGTSMSPDGAMTDQMQPLTQPPLSEKTKTGGTDPESAQLKQERDSDQDAEPTATAEEAEEILKQAEESMFEKVENQIRQALEDDKELRDLTNNLIMDITNEGLRIQLVDQDKTAMFPSGSAQMYEKTKKLIGLVAKAVEKLPNKISVRGHTDGAPYPEGSTYTNWELSADRANSSRRALLDAGLKRERIENVQGRADTDHLDKANPMAPLNRRISMVILREPPKPKEVERIRKEIIEKRVKAKAKMKSPKEQFERQAPANPFRAGGGIILE